jgi:hypothetical protein
MKPVPTMRSWVALFRMGASIESHLFHRVQQAKLTVLAAAKLTKPAGMLAGARAADLQSAFREPVVRSSQRSYRRWEHRDRLWTVRQSNRRLSAEPIGVNGRWQL